MLGSRGAEDPRLCPGEAGSRAETLPVHTEQSFGRPPQPGVLAPDLHRRPDWDPVIKASSGRPAARHLKTLIHYWCVTYLDWV